LTRGFGTSTASRATFGYPGLPLCDCIHAPRWVQVTYLSMGPIYFGLAEWLGLNRRAQQR
jgi:hypothetical protein